MKESNEYYTDNDGPTRFKVWCSCLDSYHNESMDCSPISGHPAAKLRPMTLDGDHPSTINPQQIPPMTEETRMEPPDFRISP